MDRSDPQHLFIGEFVSGAALSRVIMLPALVEHVNPILSHSPRKEMSRIHTAAVIAPMANEVTVRDGAVEKLEADVRCLDLRNPAR